MTGMIHEEPGVASLPLADFGLPNPQDIPGVEAANLPAGYSFAYSDTITVEELTLQLQRFHGYIYYEDQVARDLRTEAVEGIHRYVVGVRMPNGELVGSAALLYDHVEAEFDNLIVKKSERKHGIGRALVDRRIEIADALGITVIGMQLREDSRLATYYADVHGFEQYVDTDDGAVIWVRTRLNKRAEQSAIES